MTEIAGDFVHAPYWWDAAPPTEGTTAAPPEKSDVAVIGAGITGLHTALELAQRGVSVVVMDAEKIGWGSSSRNNGTIVPYLYLKQYQLEQKFGNDLGAKIAITAVKSIEFLLHICEQHGIDAQIKKYDRYFLALSEKHRKTLKKSAEMQRKSGVDTGWNPISNETLLRDTGYGGFHGGVYTPGALAMHPGLYVAGVARACTDAGAAVVTGCKVKRIERSGDGYRLDTSKGPLIATNVVLATNGYTGPEFRFARDSLMRIPVYMAATEPLPPDLKQKLFPKDRLLVDSKTNITWLRSSPDGRRLLVGGRAGMRSGDPRQHAKTLHRDMTRLLPELAPLKITHCWGGMTAFPLDLVPHIGRHDGVHYAVGFCGVGMTIGGWLGNRLAKKILGLPAEEHETPFDALPLRRQPFPGCLGGYTAAGLAWINLKDSWDTRGRS